MTDRRWTWGLIALGVAARAAAVLALQSHLVPHSTFEHGEIAANLLEGRGFSIRFLGADGPTSQQAPLYPLLVAAAYAAGGIGMPRALLILELGQALLGGWLVAETIRLARSVAPGREWVAIVAGLAVAVHPTLVYAATHVQVAGLASVLLVATLARAYEAKSPRDAFVVGLWLAALMLTDPIPGLVAPGLAWAMCRVGCAVPVRRGMALMGLAALLGISPWVVRNAVVHGEFVPIKSTFGYAFWQGNCRESRGTDKVVRDSVETTLGRGSASLRDLNANLWAARHEAGYIDDIALTKADYAILGSASEPERSRILFRRALHDLEGKPGRYLALCLRRLRYFVLFDETNPKTRNRLYRAAHLGLTAFALVGLALAPDEVRRRLGPTVLTVALIAAFHALTIVSARFHLPIEPLLATWGASGLARFAPRSDREGEAPAEREGSLGRNRLGRSLAPPGRAPTPVS
jgi:hypothetical protein